MRWTRGDWMCGACHHHNFKKREACHRCGYPKLGGEDVSGYLCNVNNAAAEALAGDWYCSAVNCGAHNYASRICCYRCNAPKFASAFGFSNGSSCPPGWKVGDWICLRVGCGVHNYASRTECFKCKTPRHLDDEADDTGDHD